MTVSRVTTSPVLAQVFRWTQGTLSFYRGGGPTRLDFRLDLDVPALLLAGLGVRPEAATMAVWTPRMGEQFRAVPAAPGWTGSVTWPSILMGLLRALRTGGTPTDLRARMGAKRGAEETGRFDEIELLCALEVALGLGLSNAWLRRARKQTRYTCPA